MEKIKLGGQMRPIAFNLRMQFVYEQTFGTSCTAAMADLVMLGFASQDPSILADEKVRATTQIKTLAELAWSALKAGHKEAGEDFTADVFDVVCWIDEAPESSGELVQSILNALPRANEQVENKKKVKTTPRMAKAAR